MPISGLVLLEAALLTSSCSADAFAASFAYGSQKIRIPFKSVMVIDLVCSGVLGLAVFAGKAVKQFLPTGAAVAVSFTLLFVMGLVKLLDSWTKSLIRKHSGICKEIEFSLLNFKCILNLYANPEDADSDASKDISPGEAVGLAAALSLDGLAVGFGAALTDANAATVFLISLLTHLAAVLLGCYLGNKLAGKTRINLTWLGGAVLLVLAFINLF